MAKDFFSSRHVSSQCTAWIGWIIFALLGLPQVRSLLEADMRLHMLMQFPLLIATGMLIASSLPRSVKDRLMPWNRHGISGLVLAACISTFWMIPRALDEVLIQPWLEVLKFVSLTLGVGGALVLSWNTAGFLIQGFFLGNLLPMMTAVGWLYVESPVRLCNAYLTSQQENTGAVLIWASITAAIAWIASFFIQTESSKTH